MTAALRVGLIGAGPWAHAHARHLQDHPRTELVGIWARRAEAAVALATEVGSTAFGDLDQMLAQAAAVDLCVPPSAQPALAVRAARAGKHLLLEKPLALDIAGAQAIADAVEETGVVSQVMLSRRFHPTTAAFLASLPDRVGTVDGISAHYVHGAFLGGSFATPWRLTEGVLMDLGPHLFDLMEQAAGPIRALTARRNDHDALAVITEHEGGALGSALLSGRSNGAGAQRMLVFGEGGKAVFDAAAVDEPTVFSRALTDMAEAVENGRPVLADAGRGLALQHVLAACRSSLTEGSRTTVPAPGRRAPGPPVVASP